MKDEEKSAKLAEVITRRQWYDLPGPLDAFRCETRPGGAAVTRLIP
jgi:hypothetical protein